MSVKINTTLNRLIYKLEILNKVSNRLVEKYIFTLLLYAIVSLTNENATYILYDQLCYIVDLFEDDLNNGYVKPN